MTPKTPAFPDRMDRIAAAAYLGLSVSSLAADVVTGRLQVPRIQLGRRVVYDRQQLDKWMATHTINA